LAGGKIDCKKRKIAGLMKQGADKLLWLGVRLEGVASLPSLAKFPI
jgi:hypothetical protein